VTAECEGSAASRPIRVISLPRGNLLGYLISNLRRQLQTSEGVLGKFTSGELTQPLADFRGTPILFAIIL